MGGRRKQRADGRNEGHLQDHGRKNTGGREHSEDADGRSWKDSQRQKTDRSDAASCEHYRPDLCERCNDRRPAIGKLSIFLVIPLQNLNRMARRYRHNQNRGGDIEGIHGDRHQTHDPKPPDHTQKCCHGWNQHALERPEG